MNLDIYQRKLVDLLKEKGIQDARVLAAFAKIPRHRFVDEALAQDAYKDNALPIGNSQTISQPYVVAGMTQALRLGKDDKILEIGTGSGFQAAVLAEFSRRVYTVERDPQLAEKARKRLREMGYQNIMIKVGDGSMGWVANAPYDRIIVTAGATESVPESLLKQLADGGRMIIPTGDRKRQELLLIQRRGNEYSSEKLGSVVFVPLIGKEGWH